MLHTIIGLISSWPNISQLAGFSMDATCSELTAVASTTNMIMAERKAARANNAPMLGESKVNGYWALKIPLMPSITGCSNAHS
jgi:hypothetical protein